MLGDFDGDGRLGGADIDQLCAAAHAAELLIDRIELFDLNTDGQVTDADVDFWVTELAQTVRGDVNLDESGKFHRLP